mmetsp:Transcript_16587/g.19335  ORF Transcript_16587/g.19335 Transcript_16587/m.19335 type:complete len:436 (+) Transcript_16587:46-1353(+)
MLPIIQSLQYRLHGSLRAKNKQLSMSWLFQRIAKMSLLQNVDFAAAKAKLKANEGGVEKIRDKPLIAAQKPQPIHDPFTYKKVNPERLQQLGIFDFRNQKEPGKESIERLEQFRSHAIEIVTDPGKLACEYRNARKMAEGMKGYKKRITKPTDIVRARNRYDNIQTLEDARVHLQVEDEESDYINASFIHSSLETSIPSYIASQAPLKRTVSHFWQMCVEQAVNVIVMLTPYEENGKRKADHYFPMEIGDDEVYKNTNGKSVSVSCTMKKASEVNGLSGSLVKRVFTVSLESKEREIEHFHFTAWPDFGNVSKPSTLLSLLDIVNENHNSSQPILTHCSAGVGRTGTYLAIDIIRKALKNVPDYEINVQQTVSALRNQRPLMVMTVQQYAMIYRALLLWLFDTDCVASIENDDTDDRLVSDEARYKKQRLENFDV